MDDPIPATPVDNPDANKKKLNPAFMAGLVGSQLFDAGTTQAALNRPNTREANGVISPLTNNPMLLYGSKAGIGLASSYALNKLSQAGHPKLARALSIAAMSAPTLAGIHNLRVK